jgi:hypothetical protein
MPVEAPATTTATTGTPIGRTRGRDWLVGVALGNVAGRPSRSVGDRVGTGGRGADRANPPLPGEPAMVRDPGAASSTDSRDAGRRSRTARRPWHRAPEETQRVATGRDVELDIDDVVGEPAAVERPDRVRRGVIGDDVRDQDRGERRSLSARVGALAVESRQGEERVLDVGDELAAVDGRLLARRSPVELLLVGGVWLSGVDRGTPHLVARTRSAHELLRGRPDADVAAGRRPEPRGRSPACSGRRRSRTGSDRTGCSCSGRGRASRGTEQIEENGSDLRPAKACRRRRPGPCCRSCRTRPGRRCGPGSGLLRAGPAARTAEANNVVDGVVARVVDMEV